MRQKFFSGILIVSSLTLMVGILPTHLHAKVSLLSPWSFQGRLPTASGQIDQAVSLQPGLDGVAPPGAEGKSDFVGIPYQITYGLTDNFEIGSSWGLLMVDRDMRSSEFGISDLIMAARYRFFDPDRRARVPGLDIELGFSIPTGSFDNGLGTGAFGVIFGWGIILPLDPVRTHFGMGFRLNTENSDDVQVGSVFSYNLGLSFPVNRHNDDILLVGELKGFNHGRNEVMGQKVGSQIDEFYLAPGAIWEYSEGYRFQGSFLLGLTSDSSDVGFNLEVQF